MGRQQVRAIELQAKIVSLIVLTSCLPVLGVALKMRKLVLGVVVCTKLISGLEEVSVIKYF